MQCGDARTRTFYIQVASIAVAAAVGAIALPILAGFSLQTLLGAVFFAMGLFDGIILAGGSNIVVTDILKYLDNKRITAWQNQINAASA